MSLVYHRGPLPGDSQGYKNAAHVQTVVFHPQHHEEWQDNTEKLHPQAQTEQRHIQWPSFAMSYLMCST